MWIHRTAVAIPIWKEHKVEWIDFEGSVVFQANIPHCRKWDSDSTVDIVHELLKLKPVSRIGTEISTLENVQGSTLPGRDACKQERSSTSYEDRDLHIVSSKEYTDNN